MRAKVLAGSGTAAWGDGQGTQAHFNQPTGVAVDSDGNIIVADFRNHRIRKISPDGTVTTLAGSGTAAWGDGRGTQVHFNFPGGVAVDGDGNIIVADCCNHRIRKISPDGTVTTLAGSGTAAWGDGRGIQAHFNCPSSVAVDGDGNIIVADNSNHRIRKISPDGTVTTLAGSAIRAWNDGKGVQVHFNYPSGVAVDVEGNVLVADYNNQRIRKISPDGTVTTLLTCSGKPRDVAVDGDGNVIVADESSGNCVKISPDGTSTALARNVKSSWSVAVDGEGNVIVADFESNRILCIAARLAPPFSCSQLPPQLPSVFVSQMEAMFNDEALSDVTFLVNGARIKAHRNILVARSDYFRAMLTSGFSEEKKKDKEIKIGDTTPEAFTALLRYLYTDQLIFDDEHLIDVMRKAKEISLERVYDYAVRRCRSHISVRNVVGWLVKSDESGLEDLRSATLRFLGRNFRKVRAQARETLQVLRDKPHLMMDLMLEEI